MTAFDLSVLFFLQMAFILGVCRVLGWLFTRLGQSQVVSEMIAGVVMGPSLMGWLFDGFSAWLFPAESRPILFAVAQLGLVLYMFLVGVAFDWELIRSRVRSAASVSLAGILAPFVLGGTLAFFLAGDTALFSSRTTTTQAVLFLGAAMSITAFPMLARIIVEQGLSKTSLGTLALVMLGAWFTDMIQIYAVFGAFVMGLAMPRGRFAEDLKRQIHPLTTALLLPVFFVYSGLNTKIGLVNTPALWGLALLVLLVATTGKGVACYAAARLHGEPHREALGIGTLMNARGLMELIILNIGLHKGIIEPALFAIMVMMAIVTTLLATPVFNRVYRPQPAPLPQGLQPTR